MPHNALRRALQLRADITPAGLLIGMLIGAALMLFVIVVEDSKPPVTIIEANEFDGIAQRSGYLEMRYRFLRTQECNSVSAAWLWQWRADELGNRYRYVVGLGGSPVTMADPDPMIQDFVFTVPLPPAATPGVWNLRLKYLDSCHLMSAVFGPSVRVMEVPHIEIVERAR